MRFQTILLLAFLVSFTFPESSIRLFRPSDLKVRFSIAERKIPKDKDGVVKAQICVSNTGRQSVLVFVDEPIRLGYKTEKRRLTLVLGRDYSEFNFRIPQLKLLKPNKRLVMKRSVSTALFAEISEGKWQLKSSIGYIAENDFEKLGLTPEILKKKKPKEKVEIESTFSPLGYAEIQNFEISNGVEIELVGPNDRTGG